MRSSTSPAGLCDALTAKPAPLLRAGYPRRPGVYLLDGEEAAQDRRSQRRHRPAGLPRAPQDPAIARYLAQSPPVAGNRPAPRLPRLALAAGACAARAGPHRLLRTAPKRKRRPVETPLGRDMRVAVHARDGYAAMRALLPPKHRHDEIRPRTGADRSARTKRNSTSSTSPSARAEGRAGALAAGRLHAVVSDQAGSALMPSIAAPRR
jgi:hypothetical protein